MQLEKGLSYNHSLIDFPEHILLEETSGPLLQEFDYIRVKHYNLPEFSIKYGLGSRTEVRIGSTLLHSKTKFGKNSFPVSPDTYLQDWAFGLKFQALDFNNSKGVLSFLANLTFQEVDLANI